MAQLVPTTMGQKSKGDLSWMNGLRIVDLVELASQMYCTHCGFVLELNRTVKEFQYGLASVLSVVCGKCETTREVHTSKTVAPHTVAGNTRYDINQTACREVLEVKSEGGAVLNFLALLNIPLAWDQHSEGVATSDRSQQGVAASDRSQHSEGVAASDRSQHSEGVAASDRSQQGVAASDRSQHSEGVAASDRSQHSEGVAASDRSQQGVAASDRSQYNEGVAASDRSQYNEGVAASDRSWYSEGVAASNNPGKCQLDRRQEVCVSGTVGDPGTISRTHHSHLSQTQTSRSQACSRSNSGGKAVDVAGCHGDAPATVQPLYTQSDGKPGGSGQVLSVTESRQHVCRPSRQTKQQKSGKRRISKGALQKRTTEFVKQLQGSNQSEAKALKRKREEIPDCQKSSGVSALDGSPTSCGQARQLDDPTHTDHTSTAVCFTHSLKKVRGRSGSSAVEPPSCTVEPPSCTVEPPSCTVEPPSCTVEPPSCAVAVYQCPQCRKERASSRGLRVHMRMHQASGIHLHAAGTSLAGHTADSGQVSSVTSNCAAGETDMTPCELSLVTEERRTDAVASVKKTDNRDVANTKNPRSRNVANTKNPRSRNVANTKNPRSRNVANTKNTRSRNVANTKNTRSRNITETKNTYSSNVADTENTHGSVGARTKNTCDSDVVTTSKTAPEQESVSCPADARNASSRSWSSAQQMPSDKGAGGEKVVNEASPARNSQRDGRPVHHYRFQCVDCKKRFSYSAEYAMHMRAAHGVEKPYQCRRCPEAFATENQLKIHRKSHVAAESVATHECSICLQLFPNGRQLRAHRTTHTREERLKPLKRYKCDICGEEFQKNYFLQVHLRYHTGEKPYKCFNCEAAFVSKPQRTSHVKKCLAKKKTYLCELCGGRFGSTCTLRKHERVHTGEKPHKCRFCEQSFSRRNTLKIHERQHTGERPYVCDQCAAAFKQRVSLVSHMRNKHNIDATLYCQPRDGPRFTHAHYLSGKPLTSNKTRKSPEVTMVTAKDDLETLCSSQNVASATNVKDCAVAFVPQHVPQNLGVPHVPEAMEESSNIITLAHAASVLMPVSTVSHPVILTQPHPSSSQQDAVMRVARQQAVSMSRTPDMISLAPVARSVHESQDMAVVGSSHVHLPQDVSLVGTSHVHVPQDVSLVGTSHVHVPQDVSVVSTSHVRLPQDVSVVSTSHVHVPQDVSVVSTSHVHVPQDVSVVGTSHVHVPQDVSVVSTSHVHVPQDVSVVSTSHVHVPQDVSVVSTSHVHVPQDVSLVGSSQDGGVLSVVHEENSAAGLEVQDSSIVTMCPSSQFTGYEAIYYN